MLLLYPGELYRLLGASSYYSDSFFYSFKKIQPQNNASKKVFVPWASPPDTFLEENPSNDYFIKILFLLSKWFQTKRFLWEFP
jgi:hypothetical protein